MSRGIKSADLADESGYHRSHVLRIRQAAIEPSRDAIAAIVSALRRLSLEDVRAETVFELSMEESGAWRKGRTDRFAREVAAFHKTRDRAQQLLIELSRAPRSEWLNELRHTPDGISAVVARTATLEGRRLIDHKPSYAEALTGLGAEVADEASDLTADYQAFLSGRARVERADALRQLGRYREALPLLEEAERRFEGVPSCTHELGRAWFRRGAILFKMNSLDEALRYLRRSVNIFAALDDHRRAAQAHFVEANILFEQSDVDSARKPWLEIAPIFQAAKDRHSLASLWLNVAWCAIEQREPDTARALLHRAVDLFTQLRSSTDIARTQWAFALTEAWDGNRASGLRALRLARESMENLGLAVEAGIVGLDIAEILLLDPAAAAEGAALCRELVPLFESAGAAKEATRAISLGRLLPDKV